MKVVGLDNLECRIKQLEDSAKEMLATKAEYNSWRRMVDDIKVKVSQNCEKLSRDELHQAAVDGAQVNSGKQKREKRTWSFTEHLKYSQMNTNDRKARDVVFA